MSRPASRRLATLATQLRPNDQLRKTVRKLFRRLFVWVGRKLTRHATVVAFLIPGLAGVSAYWASGAVACGIVGTYAALGVWAVRMVRVSRHSAHARAIALETVGALAGELRAGSEASAVSALVASWLRGEVPAAARLSHYSDFLRKPEFPGTPETREVVRRMAMACQVSERLGAPLADLFDGIERDLRSSIRVRKSLSAQVSGSWATVVILAILPLGGLGLGAGLGADPLRQLLHTPLGGGCAGVALILQASGLLWTSTLVSKATESLC